MVDFNPAWASRLCVVGGGAAGTLTALHLLQDASAEGVVLVERSREIGSGVAYSTLDRRHLLNVPAAKMSAFPSTPDDFTNWLHQREPRVDGFVPRHLFGDYLRDRLAAAPAHGHLQRVRGDVVEITPIDGSVAVHLRDGRQIDAAAVVLAVGQPRIARPEMGTTDVYDHPRYIADPWAPRALGEIAGGHSVLLVGTGLTMVDVAVTLGSRGATLTAVSRHGLIPLPHPQSSPQPLPAVVPRTVGLGGLVRWARSAATAAADSGVHWSSSIDALRPLTQGLWQSLSTAEQERFLRHAAPYWNVHRHRVPPATATALDQLIGCGRLRVHAGRIHEVDADRHGFRARIGLRAGSATATVRATHIVNCAGPQARLNPGDLPLIRSLLHSGLARLDPLELGLETDANGALIDSGGHASSTVYAIGALRRGTLWETTAIPELRNQAESLARLLGPLSASVAA